ncbi:MAG: transposase [Lentisphaeria bacterium]|nr:transposase [Lentisphaeria bacterium]
MSYDPAIHHRRSIRLKGHDYAGGGVYFVTICAHRQAGDIFAPPDVREMVAREWENAVGAGLVPAHEEGTHEGCPYVIMPDHFHALVRIPVGAGLVPALPPAAPALGDVIGAFKSRVVHEYIAGVKAGRWPRFPGKIWHRNYYESIVRSAEAEQRIAEYIRMNPWRCVQELGGGLRGIGNPALWGGEKLGVLCSRNAPKLGRLPAADVYLGGWHSPKEKEILGWLLQNRRPVIACPAWGIADSAFAPGVRDALEDNRMLILEMRDTSGNLAAAEARNRFVIKHADALFTPHVTPGGMLHRLLNEISKVNPS